ncbi:GIY-YIG nuclease family protein [Candidatus Falkowbacteria bacterium]|nr:GIY-YIG nuclease family protein [Candidatus Falkowbacteria bacterium]
MYYVYVIKNNKKGMIYIGYTDNLKRRLKEHKDKIPELMYYEAYRNELDAREREGKLKQRGQAVRHLKKRIKRSLE